VEREGWLIGRLVLWVITAIGAVGGAAILGALIVWARRFSRLPPLEHDDMERRNASLHVWFDPRTRTVLPGDSFAFLAPTMLVGVMPLLFVTGSAPVGMRDPDVVATAARSTPARVAAAGDIACDPDGTGFNGGKGTETTCHMNATADLLVAGDYDAVLTLGDNQYNSGTASEFEDSYDPSWGRVKDITYPSVGNHEYGTPGASGYFNYFGEAAGDPDKGYYRSTSGPGT
jgi:hypothetical protein